MTLPLTRREILTRSRRAAASLALPGAITSRVSRSARARRPAPSPRVNLALIGYGSNGQRTAANFLGDPRVQTVAVADAVSVAPVAGAHRSITIAHLANIAIRPGRSSLRRDPATERILGDPVAAAMLSRPTRALYAV